MKKKIYINTNIYWTFYHFSNEDLEELKKLTVSINTGNIELYIPKQTHNEFHFAYKFKRPFELEINNIWKQHGID
jgi:hypothetical protein